MRFRAAVVFVTGGAGFVGSAVVRTNIHVVRAICALLDEIEPAAAGASG
jgi:nucleoside-diphosphate-sugar epimerase